VVFYDALVDRAALRYAPRARWAYVGKRAFRPSISQDTIQRLMIRRALRGERVVRLKSGDPFVFGRGGEEALALAAAGIPCEVVPGVSAAVAAPRLSGIPVTHRGLSAAFVVVSGHSEAAFAPVLGSLAPGTATVVVLMGLQTRALVADRLLSTAGRRGRRRQSSLPRAHRRPGPGVARSLRSAPASSLAFTEACRECWSSARRSRSPQSSRPWGVRARRLADRWTPLPPTDPVEPGRPGA
jgi:precorrin-6B methylase 1